MIYYSQRLLHEYLVHRCSLGSILVLELHLYKIYEALNQVRLIGAVSIVSMFFISVRSVCISTISFIDKRSCSSLISSAFFNFCHQMCHRLFESYLFWAQPSVVYARLTPVDTGFMGFTVFERMFSFQT